MQTNKEFVREVVKIAIPIGLQSLVTNLVNIIDNIMVGALGETAMSGISIISSLLILLSTVTVSIGSGAMIIAAQEYGRKEMTSIKKLLSFVLAFGFCAAGLLWVACTLFPVQIVRIYTDIEEVIEPACIYLNIMKYSIFFNVITRGVSTLIRAISDVKISLIASICGCFSNMFFNYVLIYGKFGFPAIGIRGAALATCIARLVEAGVLMVYLLHFEKTLRFRLSDFNPFIGKDLLWNLMTLSVPLMIMDFLNSSSYQVQAMISGRTSKYYMSANSIVHNAWLLPNAFNGGVAAAASVMIGHSLGRKDYEEAKTNGKRFVYASMLFGLFCSVFVQVFCPILSSFYTELSQETLDMVRNLSYSCSFIVFFNCIGMCLSNGIIKAAGRTKELLIIDTVTTWLIALPISYIAAFKFNVPITVLYILLRCQHIFKSIWGTIWIHRGTWIKTVA